MTPVHRPLCEWVADVSAAQDGIASLDPWALPNRGDRWSDARRSPRFDEGWERRLVRLRTSAGELAVLGLARKEEFVVELDDTAAPIPVSSEVLEVIDRYERDWPDVHPQDGDHERLAAASPVLGHALLERLATEADSVAPALFHVLPWDAATRVADEVTAALEAMAAGRPGTPSPIFLRHWFTPTGSRFSAALDQLNAGVADRDASLVREGATALCARLLDADADRFPRPARLALASLIRGLAERDPLLDYTAEPAAERLERNTRRDGPRMLLSSELELAASGDEQREHSEEIRTGSLIVDAAVTQGGMLSITAEFELTPEQTRFALETYGNVIVRLLLVDDEDEARALLIALTPTPLGLGGSVDLVAPGGLVSALPDGPPIGTPESWLLEPAEVAASFLVADEETKAAWRVMAAPLPEHHPVVRALRDAEEHG